MIDHSKKSFHRYPSILIPESVTSLLGNQDYFISDNTILIQSQKKSEKNVQSCPKAQRKQAHSDKISQQNKRLKQRFLQKKQCPSFFQNSQNLLTIHSYKQNISPKTRTIMQEKRKYLGNLLSQFKFKILNFAGRNIQKTTVYEQKLCFNKFINFFECQFNPLCQNIFHCILDKGRSTFCDNQNLIEKKKQIIYKNSSNFFQKTKPNFIQKNGYINSISDSIDTFFTTIPTLQYSLNNKIKVIKQLCGEEGSQRNSELSLKSLAETYKETQHIIHDKSASFEKLLNLHDHQIKVLQDDLKDIKQQISKKSSTKSLTRQNLRKKTKQVSFAQVNIIPSEQNNIKKNQRQKIQQQNKLWCDNQNKNEVKSLSKQKKKTNKYQHLMSIKAPPAKFHTKNTKSNFTLKVLYLNQQLGNQNNQNIGRVNSSIYDPNQTIRQSKTNDHFWKKNQNANRSRVNSANYKQKKKIRQQMINFSIKKQPTTSKTSNIVTYKKISNLKNFVS